MSNEISTNAQRVRKIPKMIETEKKKNKDQHNATDTVLHKNKKI